MLPRSEYRKARSTVRCLAQISRIVRPPICPGVNCERVTYHDQTFEVPSCGNRMNVSLLEAK